MRQRVHAVDQGAEEAGEVCQVLGPVVFPEEEARAAAGLAEVGRAALELVADQVLGRQEISGRVAELPQVAAQAPEVALVGVQEAALELELAAEVGLEAVQVGALELAAEVGQEVAQEEMVEHHLAGESVAPEEE